ALSLGHAANVAASLIAQYGAAKYQAARQIFTELIVLIPKITTPSVTCDGLTRRRQAAVAFMDRVMSILRMNGDDRYKWMTGVSTAVDAVVKVQKECLLPANARKLAQLWRQLADALDKVLRAFTADRPESVHALPLRTRIT